MNREEIYEQLNAQIPELKKRKCTERVMQATDMLLDQLLEVQLQEELDNEFRI